MPFITSQTPEPSLEKALLSQSTLYKAYVKYRYTTEERGILEYAVTHSSKEEVREALSPRLLKSIEDQKDAAKIIKDTKVTEDQRFFIQAIDSSWSVFFNKLYRSAKNSEGETLAKRVERFDRDVAECLTLFYGYLEHQQVSSIYIHTDAHHFLVELIKEIKNADPDFMKHYPMYYNPVNDTCPKELPLALIVDEKVYCIHNKKEVFKRKAYPVSDGTWIYKDSYNADDTLRYEYVFCGWASRKEGEKMLHKAVDCVPVYSDKNGIAYNHVYIANAKKEFKYHKERDRYYSFDIHKQSRFLLSHGWVTPSSVKEEWLHKPSGVYIAPDDFHLFSYCDNVLNYYPGFKTMPFEDTVTGHSNPAFNTLFMGMELEVEMSKKATMTVTKAAEQTFRELEGHAIVESDGSLRDGYEIVSIPATLGYHYQIWEKFLRSDLRRQIVSYLRSSCGIHIHMSKESFSDLSLGKFMTFINSVENQEFIECVAQRPAGQYQERPPTKVSSGKHRGVFVDESGRRCGKYTSVNLLNKNTVEVRIFKGTLAYPQVMKNFEFLHALHKYVSFFAGPHQLHYADFINWLTEKKYGNRKMYGFLYDYLKVQGYIENKLKPATTVSAGDLTDTMAESGEKGAERVSGIPIEKLEMVRRSSGHRVGLRDRVTTTTRRVG